MPSMIALHLATGHVVGAVTGAADDATVEQLAGSDGLRTMFVDDSDTRVVVTIPTNALTATVVDHNDGVFDGTEIYVVTDDGDLAAISGEGPDPYPAMSPPALTPDDIAIAVYATPTGPVVEQLLVDSDGAIDETAGQPPGATARLLALPGNTLAFDTSL